MNWVGFEYEFKTFPEILDSLKHIWDFNNFEYAILPTVIIVIFLFSLYIIPIVAIVNAKMLADYEKRKKRRLLQKIRMQKEIEEEIEEELKAEERRRVEERLKAFWRM